MTNVEITAQTTERGIVTDLSSISILCLEALPDKVENVFFSSAYFWTMNTDIETSSRTNDMAAALYCESGPLLPIS